MLVLKTSSFIVFSRAYEGSAPSMVPIICSTI